MPSIDFETPATLEANGIKADVTVGMLVTWDERDCPGRWTVEEYTVNGLNADELGLIDWCETVADAVNAQITDQCIDADSARRDWEATLKIEAANRNREMTRGLR